MILLLGLVIAQIIATIQVYLSNLNLNNTLTNVASAGYLAIPTKQVMGSLRDFSPAFWGGLFFTFTIGAGISLGAMPQPTCGFNYFGAKDHIWSFLELSGSDCCF
jgi:hypothetical protein